MTEAPSVALTAEELQKLTGYKLASKQLKELHRQGFHRARLGRAGKVVLERAHFEAVCRGEVPTAQAARPKVRPAVRTPA